MTSLDRDTETNSVDWTDLEPALQAGVREACDKVYDPCSVAHGVKMGLVEMGLVKSVSRLDDGTLGVELRLTSPFCEMVGYFSREVAIQCEALPGIDAVRVTFDRGFDWSKEAMTPSARNRQAKLLPLSPVRRDASDSGSSGTTRP